MHMPEGKHYMIGVDRDQPVSGDAKEVTALVGKLQVFAVHANEAAAQVFQGISSRADDPKLTDRELEALRWTTTGKTAREVADAMGISERTAAVHLIRATKKLLCVALTSYTRL